MEMSEEHAQLIFLSELANEMLLYSLMNDLYDKDYANSIPLSMNSEEE